MDKVKLPKEVAEAIKTLKNAEITTFEIICSLAHERWGHSKHVSEAHKTLRKFSFGNSGRNGDVLLKALVNDYELEPTPEEKVLSEYKARQPYSNYGNAYRQGVRDTLNAYGIKIEGVNA
ncbi:hypothetical protein [Aneurinibacillus migulanus]|uniref:Uncharacterized protein n=1 Tax=Aneurinibacillus migulanus TaxID=47500 RepID=A0A0D1XZR2_ANEMI|nr:hypothetical protein [Aneurinibacillus migulanus]KIV57533.1 hypothetical protein TS65_09960 [Aneurinibacillus migulanus]KON94847.1 hypothetical protein AF333_04465 [Aneurinibacillus migulanus]MED0892892.1 hypothetical protein [Aneurinibacillus migulanus]MED1619138.1 hypothetical protein [Aneurinibacillus migulanus]SDI91352.1 hypothetical protein SAMN04487909_10970 [Aneurinibacillus migulanus]